MSAVLAGILIDVAAKVGAPIVKSILEKHVSGEAAEIGKTVIDTIAEKACVAPEDIPTASPEVLANAVQQVEAETPDIILAHVQSQKLSTDLQTAEMQTEEWWAWAWRPAGMWLMLICIAWYIMGRPILQRIVGPLPSEVAFSDFVTVFITFTGFYMGGHTAIRMWKQKQAGAE
jgi:hypothetical protein